MRNHTMIDGCAESPEDSPHYVATQALKCIIRLLDKAVEHGDDDAIRQASDEALASLRVLEADVEVCPECLAEEKGDAMRDEQKDPDWGSSYDDIDEEPRRCGLDN